MIRKIQIDPRKVYIFFLILPFASVLFTEVFVCAGSPEVTAAACMAHTLRAEVEEREVGFSVTCFCANR